jgi:hypothetical protein
VKSEEEEEEEEDDDNEIEERVPPSVLLSKTVIERSCFESILISC